MGLVDVELTQVDDQTDTYTYTDAIYKKQWTITKTNDGWRATSDNTDGMQITDTFNSNGVKQKSITTYLDDEENPEGKSETLFNYDEHENYIGYTWTDYNKKGKPTEESNYDENGIITSKTICKYKGEELAYTEKYAKDNDSWDYTYTPAGKNATTISIDSANISLEKARKIFYEALIKINADTPSEGIAIFGKTYTITQKEDGSWIIKENE